MNNNESFFKWWLKKFARYAVISSIAFLGGFAIYAWKCSRSEPIKKILSLDQLKKLLNKMRNLCIHIMVQRYDKKTKLKGRIHGDDIAIEDIQVEKSSENSITEIVANKTKSLSNEDTGESLDFEMYQILLEIELELAMKAGVNPSEYQETLEAYIHNE